MALPPVFVERLKRILPAEHAEAVLAGFSIPRKFTLRVNTLKAAPADAVRHLESKGLRPEPVAWCAEALVLDASARAELRGDDWLQDGRLYPQNLSSLIPAIALGARPGERVLDLCAAPGSKTTQIAAGMRNQGEITAVEVIRDRYFKLKSVCELTGVRIAKLVCCDGRRFDPSHGAAAGDKPLFDRILVDAPCSSEGLFDASDPETIGYWSERKIDEASKKQRGLLLSASRLLKPGGTLVYSTCSFAPEENEATVDWFLKKAAPGFRCVPPAVAGFDGGLPALEGWGKRTFHPDVRRAMRVLPDPSRIGFFVAKFVLE